MNNEKHKSNSILAIKYMMLSVFIASFAPLFFYNGKADDFPFFFNAIVKLSQCMAVGGFLFLNYKEELFNRQTWMCIKNNIFSWTVVLILIGGFDFALIGLSLKYIDISIVTVLHETWPIWAILLLNKILKKENRYSKINIFDLCLIFIAFIGMVFLVGSQTGDMPLYNENPIKSEFIFGVAAAILAAITSSFLGFTIKWGIDTNNSTDQFKDYEKDMSLFFALIAFIATAVISAIINIFFDLHGNDNKFEANHFLYPFIFGLLLSIAVISYRKSLLITTRLELNALLYLSPVLSLVWLWLADYIEVANHNWLLIGASAIVITNYIINLKENSSVMVKIYFMIGWVIFLIFLI